MTTPAERLAAAIHLESAAIAPQTSPLIEAAKEMLAENEGLRSIPAALRAEYFAMAHTDMVGDEERRAGYLAALRDCERMITQQLSVTSEEGK